MSKEMVVTALGLLTTILSVGIIGIPSSWKMFILVFIGIAVAVLGFLLRGEALSRGIKKTEHHPFVENTEEFDNSRHDHKGGIT